MARSATLVFSCGGTYKSETNEGEYDTTTHGSVDGILLLARDV